MRFQVRGKALKIVLSLAVVAGMTSTARVANSGELPSVIATIDTGVLTVWTPEGGGVVLSLPAPVYRADMAPDGDKIVVATGLPISEQLEGVIGQVHVVDLSTLETIVSTSFLDTVITHVAFNRTGTAVAFIKDYTELWILDLVTGEVRQLTEAQALTPTIGSVVFDPAFSWDGAYVYFGLTEKTFQGGEDDKLDNIWKVSLTGTPTRVTSLAEGPNYEDWLIVRSPTPMPDGSLMYSMATSGASTEDIADPEWQLAVSDAFGVHYLPGYLPSPATGLEIAGDRVFFLKYNSWDHTVDLYVMPAPTASNGTWSWCQEGCEVLVNDVDWATVAP